MRSLRHVAIGLLAVGIAVSSSAVAHAAKRPARPTRALDARLADAQALLAAGRYAQAESTARALLPLKGNSRPVAIDSAAVLAVVVQAMWQNDRERTPGVLDLSERALHLRERALGPNAPLTIASLCDWSRLLAGNSRQAEAESTARRAVVLAERTLGPDDPLTATAHHHLGLALYLGRHYDGALEEFQHGLAIRERRLPPNDPLIGTSWRAIGVTYLMMDDWDGEVAAWRKALDNAERSLPEDHPDHARALQGLGTALYHQQDYVEAERLAERSLDMTERLFGPNHPRVAYACMQLAWNLGATGELGRAKSLYERAYHIFSEVLGPEDAVTLGALDFVAAVSVWSGECAAGLPIEMRVLEARRRVLGPTHPHVAQSLTTLEQALECTGDYERALAATRDEEAVYATMSQPPIYGVLSMMRRQGRLLARLGKPDSARVLLARALEMSRSHFDDGSRPVELAEEGLGEALLAIGRPDTALRLLTHVTEVAERIYGPLAFETGRLLAERAEAEAAARDTLAAIQTALRAEDAGRASFRATARGFSENEALAAAGVRPQALDLAVALAGARTPVDTVTRSVWDAVIRSRSLVLEEIASRRQFVAGDDSVLLRLDATRRQVAGLMARGPVGSDSTWADRVQAAERARDQAERSAALAHAGMGARLARDGAGLSEVERALGPGEALVGYVRHTSPATGAPPTASWSAFVRSPAGRVSIVRLGSARVIDPLISDWARELGRPLPTDRSAARSSTKRCRATGEQVRKLVWDPVASRIKGAQRVSLVPDAGLALVNLGALPTSGDRWLVETGPTIALLGAERDRIESPVVDSSSGGLLALGSIDYDAATAGAPVAALAGSAGMGAGATRTDATNSSERSELRGLPPCSAFDRVRFSPLPETGRELDDVGVAWTDARAGGALMLRGSDAGEAEFKHLAAGHRVIHMATHGFYVDPWCSTAADTNARGVSAFVARTSMGDAYAPAAPNPLRLAGLALSGANARDRAPPDAEDGILTAGEIASIDLSGLDLVTMSACESGLGETVRSEGVMGLRRAFRIAGARTVVMSLWPVRDELTREWMTDFYRGLWHDRRDVATAVQTASRSAIRRLREQKLPAHPVEWAGFVAESSGQ